METVHQTGMKRRRRGGGPDVEVCPSQRGLQRSRWCSLLPRAWLRLVDVRGGTGLMRGGVHICLDYPSREEAERTTGGDREEGRRLTRIFKQLIISALRQMKRSWNWVKAEEGLLVFVTWQLDPSVLRIKLQTESTKPSWLMLTHSLKIKESCCVKR